MVRRTENSGRRFVGSGTVVAPISRETGVVGMEIRGERECKECGTRWSYFETGSVECPDCGSLVSVGRGDRKLHTDAPVELKLTDLLARVDEEPLGDLTEEIAERCRPYVNRRGFVRAGELASLDDAYLTAVELRHAADIFSRVDDPTDPERLYLVSLLRAVDTGNRPPPAEVPDRLREARGLAAADAALEYRSAITRLTEPIGDLRTALSRIRDRAKRIEALDGDVAADEAEALVRATRAVGRALVLDDSEAVDEALDLLTVE